MNSSTGKAVDFDPRADTLSLSQGEDTPWPLREVLAVLVEATEHLMDVHDCDVLGHERFVEACRVAKRMLAEEANVRGGGRSSQAREHGDENR